MNIRQPRGVALMDMMMTLALITIAFTMSTKLIDRIWKTQRQMESHDRAFRQDEQARTLLTRDVRDAKTLNVSPATLTINNAIIWNLTGKQIERRSGDKVSRWEAPQPNLRFENAQYGAILVGDQSRLPLMNPIQWAQKAVIR